MNIAAGDTQSWPAHLHIVDNVGHVTGIDFRTLGSSSVRWDTTSVPNGTVSLYAVMYCSTPNKPYLVTSPTINVAVQNGFYLNTDAAKTYAKVTQPTNGQSITANGANFSITSDHQITWTRYDNCGSYRPYYKFRRTTTYPNVADVVVAGNYTLPLQTNDCPYQRTLGDVGYASGGPTPVVYIVYAFCYTPDDNTQVASGNGNFTMTPVK